MKPTHITVCNRRIEPTFERLCLIRINEHGNGVFANMEDGGTLICPMTEDFVLRNTDDGIEPNNEWKFPKAKRPSLVQILAAIGRFFNEEVWSFDLQRLNFRPLP